LVNKHLIAEHCQRHNITITNGEVDDEIARVAGRFNLGVEQWLQMLEKERGISPHHYARDIIWPTLALRKLAADKLTVSEKELREAYETEYGPAVQARLIAVHDLQLAKQLHAQLVARPEEFARLAREHSQ